ncbi:MAG: VOC family protein [Kofleriaceae bacterium]
MLLNHLDLQSTDVQTLAAFFVDHFGFTRVTNNRSPAIAVLDGEGFSLVIQRNDAPAYPDGFHLGFIQPSIADVQAHHERLTNAGVTIGAISSDNRGTRFYLRAPGEILIEISTPTRSA